MQFGEWVSKGGSVSPNTAAVAWEDCERMVRSGDRIGRGGYDKKRSCSIRLFVVAGNKLIAYFGICQLCLASSRIFCGSGLL